MLDYNKDGAFNGLADGGVVAYFKQYENVVYTNIDASCDGPNSKWLSTCLSKGDRIFLPAGGFRAARSTNPE
jgi:hypothetical protein